jgi:hypothetical protein
MLVRGFPVLISPSILADWESKHAKFVWGKALIPGELRGWGRFISLDSDFGCFQGVGADIVGPFD